MFDRTEVFQEMYNEGPDYWSEEYQLRKAERLNCTPEYSDAYTLQLDLDSEDAYNTFLAQYDLLRELPFINDVVLGWNTVDEQRSRSGNRHVTIKLSSPQPALIRILLQALLGSDLKRELLSYTGLLHGQGRPSVLFRPKPKGESNDDQHYNDT